MRKFLAAACAALTVGLVAPATAATAATDDDTEKFCDLNFDISLTFNTVSDEPTAKELKALSKKLKPMLTAAQKVAPSEIATDVDTAAEAIIADPSSLFTDDSVGQAGEAIDEWAVDNCDYETLDVTAADYSFTGIPSTMEKGKVVVSFTNEGAEAHVLVIARNKGKLSTQEVLELPEQKAIKQVEIIGEAFAPPGGSGTAYLDITKSGDYIALCPIPTGTTGETEGTGPPHFVHGMVEEFTVS